MTEMTPQERGELRRRQQIAVLFALYERCGGRPYQQVCEDELADKLGLSVEIVDARLVELHGLRYVTSFESGPCCTLSEPGRDYVEQLLLDGPDSELRRSAVRLTELRMAFLHQVYELAEHSVTNTVSPDDAGKPIGVTDSDDLYGLVWWLEKRSLIAQYGHLVTLRAEGIELIEEARLKPSDSPAAGLAPLQFAIAVVTDSPGAQVMQFSPSGTQISRVTSGDAAALVALIKEIRDALDEVDEDSRAVVAANLDMAERKVSAGNADDPEVERALRHVLDIAKQTGSTVIGGLILRYLAGAG